MPVALSTVLSTASLVTLRSAGVAARTLSLLALATGMPAEQFAPYGIAFVLSELARCATDFGLDPVVLRRAEGLPLEEQRPLLRAALAIRCAHGLISAVIVMLLLIAIYSPSSLLIVAGMQFISQGMLQLGLNWRQVNNSAHRVAPYLLSFYAGVVGLAVFGYFHPSFGTLPLPTLLIGELAIAVVLLRPLAFPQLRDLVQGYGSLVPQALPMAAIMLLAFVNTRTDALVVGQFASPAQVGHYLYLARWGDLAPMLATGVALPMVGKLKGFRVRHGSMIAPAALLVLCTIPFGLIATAAALNPAYSGDQTLRCLLATIASCRIGLAVTTMLLLAQWRDRLLMKIATLTTALVPVLTWLFGSWYGIHGIATGVLVAEAGNLLFQASLLLGRRFRKRAILGNANG